MKMTPWFSASEKPARVGIYEISYQETPDKVDRLFWDGKRWLCARANIWAFDIPSFFGAAYPGDKWRGLAKESK